MSTHTKITKTVATQQKYRQRTFELARRCRTELQVLSGQTLDYRQMVGWLVNLKQGLSRPTWRQYKASVVYFLEQEILKKNDAIAQEALDFLLPIDAQGCVKKTRKTSGSKMKKFPLKDFAKLTHYLDEHPHLWHHPVKRWLIATLLTGLRPSEWATAALSFHDQFQENVLLVQNAKNTNGRAHGPTRHILLGKLSQEERDIIHNHVQRCQEWETSGQFSHYYKACAVKLSQAVRSLWPNRIERLTLYSARHQFAADAKASGLLREEIAALMGHAVDDTATIHYGKKTAGAQLIRVRPDPQEVILVRKVFKNRFVGEQNEPHPTKISS